MKNPTNFVHEACRESREWGRGRGSAEAKYPVSPETVEAPVYLKSRPACVLCMFVCRRVCMMV